MDKSILIVSSITYAMKGKDILNNNGFNATIKRISKNKVLNGCGYGILVLNDAEKAETLLIDSNIEVLDRIDMEETK